MASSLTYKKQLPGLRMEKQEHFLIKKESLQHYVFRVLLFKIVFNFPTTQKTTF